MRGFASQKINLNDDVTILCLFIINLDPARAAQTRHVTDKLAALTFAVQHHHEELSARLKNKTITSRQLNEAKGAHRSLVGCCLVQHPLQRNRNPVHIFVAVTPVLSILRAMVLQARVMWNRLLRRRY